MAKPKLEQVYGASGAAIGAACDPKFAREFDQAFVGGASGAVICRESKGSFYE
jgi:hypothetical protein